MTTKNKVLIGLGLLLVAALPVLAAISATVQSPVSGKVQLASGPLTATTLTLINSNAAVNTTVYVYDAPSTNVTYVLAPWTNIVSYPASITNYWTNYYGVLNTNIYIGLSYVTNSQVQTTNFYPLIGTWVVSSNTAPGVGILQVDSFDYNFRYGILITNNNTISAAAVFTR